MTKSMDWGTNPYIVLLAVPQVLRGKQIQVNDVIRPLD